MASGSLTKGVRQWAPPAAAGAACASVVAAIFTWRNPDHPPVLSFVVALLVTWPMLSVAWQILWFDREATDRAVDEGRHDVERAWFQESAATAFALLMGGLIVCESLGSALNLPWLSPIGLPHVLVLGLGTFTVSYAWLRYRS